MPTTTAFYLEDEEKTLPPLPPEEESPVSDRSLRTGAVGDFRTYETTFAARRNGLFEVRLVSARGHRAHFAFEPEIAARVARELERQLSEAYYRYRFLDSRPPPPASAPLDAAGTDVCFFEHEPPTIRVEQEDRGDRIVVLVYDSDASLNITVQVGVAITLWEFLASAGGPR